MKKNPFIAWGAGLGSALLLTGVTGAIWVNQGQGEDIVTPAGSTISFFEDDDEYEYGEESEDEFESIWGDDDDEYEHEAREHGQSTSSGGS